MIWAEAVGYIGAAFVIATYSMKTMIPLRTVGIASNCVFIVYGFAAGVYPTFVLHLILLPLNAHRLRQMLQLVRKVREASQGDLSMEWLKPFMTNRRVEAGEILFRKGDNAECLFYTVTGRYRLQETEIELMPGQVVGELGMVAPERRRTQTLQCIEAGDVLTISYDSISQIYFQNPKFGFYFLKLITNRLFQNIATLQQEVEQLRAAGASQGERSAAASRS